MTDTKTIEEGNRIIAEFVGWKFDIKDGNLIGYLHEAIKFKYQETYLSTFLNYSLSYHSDWDMLMPVVEKIETMDYGFKMCRKVVEVYIDSTKEIIVKTKEANRLESLYKAVIEFLHWHNKTLQNNG